MVSRRPAALAAVLTAAAITAAGTALSLTASAVQPTVVGIGTGPGFVHLGGTITLTAAVRPAAAQQRIALQSSTDSGRTWRNLVWATTDRLGNAKAALRPLHTLAYRWNLPAAPGRRVLVSAVAVPHLYPALKAYPNCLALNADYPHGAGLPWAHDVVRGTTRPVTAFLRDAALYRLNEGRPHQDLDGDNDGVACEKGPTPPPAPRPTPTMTPTPSRPSPTPTPTPTTPPTLPPPSSPTPTPTPPAVSPTPTVTPPSPSPSPTPTDSPSPS